MTFTGSFRQFGFHQEHGGFWARFFALCIDLIFIGAISLGLAEFMGAGIFTMTTSARHSDIAALSIVCAFLLWSLYCIAMLASTWQATLGKRWLGLKVTDMRGRRLSLKRSFSRFLLAHLCLVFCGLGFLMILVTRNRQSLHDKMAGTMVVRSNGWF
jgi:uncharacterized RDD family membrane protein YckC